MSIHITFQMALLNRLILELQHLMLLKVLATV